MWTDYVTHSYINHRHPSKNDDDDDDDDVDEEGGDYDVCATANAYVTHRTDAVVAVVTVSPLD